MKRSSETYVTLVTGGAGFIGFNLCKRLLLEGAHVVCIDDLSSGSAEHVDKLAGHDRYRFILHDVREPIDLRVDRIFNLACPASPVAYQADPIKTTLTNVVGTRNMLDLARANAARFVQASTSEVYGDPLVHPQTEGYFGNVNTIGPRACYDEGKRCAETLIYDYATRYHVDARIARIFNTYGPGMREDDGRAASNFIMQSLQGHDVTVYGDGQHTRSMVYVDDLVEGLLRLMDSDNVAFAPVNLGNPQEITILELARRVVELTGSESGIVHLAEAIDDPHVRCPDISRSKALLGWEPTIALNDGLRATIDYFARRLAGPPPRRDRQRSSPIAATTARLAA